MLFPIWGRGARLAPGGCREALGSQPLGAYGSRAGAGPQGREAAAHRGGGSAGCRACLGRARSFVRGQGSPRQPRELSGPTRTAARGLGGTGSGGRAQSVPSALPIPSQLAVGPAGRRGTLGRDCGTAPYTPLLHFRDPHRDWEERSEGTRL